MKKIPGGKALMRLYYLISESNIREYLLDPEKREYLKELYSGKYVADVKSKPSGVEPAASFRKLSI